MIPSAAQAQGFGLSEIGSCAVGRGFTVTARPCADASTLFWNPAAAVRLEGLNFYAGAAAVGIGGDFTEDSTGRQYKPDVPTEVPPHLFATYRVSPRIAAGLGVYVPYGLTSQWRTDFPGRFSAIKASLATIYVQPTLALDVIPDRLSVGGGPVFGHSTVELYQAVDLSQQFLPGSTTLRFGNVGVPAGTEFARARLKGDANAWGAQFGAQLRATKTIDIGVRWLWAMYFEYDDAEATFTQTPTRIVLPANSLPGQTTAVPLDALLAAQFATGGALTTRPGSSAIKHPGQVQFGINYSGIERTNLALDYTWFSWSDFDVLPVNFGGTNPPASRAIIEDYDDAQRVGVSVEHVLNTTMGGGMLNDWAIRAGFSAATTPAPDYTVTPLLPDQDRKNYNIGLGIPLGKNFGLDVAYLKVDTDGRRGRIIERDNVNQTAEQLNSGFYRLNANIWNVSLRAHF